MDQKLVIRNSSFVILCTLLLVQGWLFAASYSRLVQLRSELVTAHQEQQAFAAFYGRVKTSSSLKQLMGMGTVFVTTGHPDLALPLFVRATTIQPVPPDAYAGAAVALDALGNPAAALAMTRRGLAYNPIWVPLLERCVQFADTVGALSIDVEASQDQKKICYDRKELIRQIPTWH